MSYSRDAQKRYETAHKVRFSLVLNDRTDQELIDHLRGQDSVNRYLKSLIEKDMEGTSSPPSLTP